MYRVLVVRRNQLSLKERYFLRAFRNAEDRIARMANWALTGSTTDARRLEEVGCKRVFMIPTTYASRPGPSAEAKPAVEGMRVVHLGSLQTTANWVGLAGYLRSAHDKASEKCLDTGVLLTLLVIGDNQNVKPFVLDLLQRDNIRLTGFVPDLDTVLRPFDVAILPYEHDTGYRTKLPLLLSYAQAIVTTEAAVAGTMLPGLEDVCVVVEKVEQFPAVLNGWLQILPSAPVWVVRGTRSSAGTSRTRLSCPSISDYLTR